MSANHERQGAVSQDDSFKWRRRLAAGWTFSPEAGWLAMDRTPEADWILEGNPLPEDEEYPDWLSTAYHYEACDYDELPLLHATADAVTHACDPR